MRNAKDYQAAKRFPIFKGYIDHFNETSIDNDIPGMLSFFFIQGQIAVPYVRIPWDLPILTPETTSFGFSRVGLVNRLLGNS